MAICKTNQFPGLGLARLCDNCRVLEDYDFLRTQANKEDDYYDWYIRQRGIKYFDIAKWPYLESDQTAPCDLCRFMSSKFQESSLGTVSMEYDIEVTGMAFAPGACWCSDHKTTGMWSICGFSITLVRSSGDNKFGHSCDLVVGSDEGNILKNHPRCPNVMRNIGYLPIRILQLIRNVWFHE